MKLQDFLFFFFFFLQQNQTGIERLQILVRQKDKREVVWNLPFWKLEINDRLWTEGQVEVRAPDDPDFLYQVSPSITINEALPIQCLQDYIESYFNVIIKIFTPSYFLGIDFDHFWKKATFLERAGSYAKVDPKTTPNKKVIIAGTLGNTSSFLMKKVEFEVVHGNHTRGFVAVDDVQLIQTNECEFKPLAAWPTETSTTTAPTTTPVPTEPPDGKEKHLLYC